MGCSHLDGERYRAIINECLIPQLDVLGLEDMSTQEDGATAHTLGVIYGTIYTAGGTLHSVANVSRFYVWYRVLVICTGPQDHPI